jgi:hypothetical protein
MCKIHMIIVKLTAMVGLSARTYSWGGDGSRFGGGVSDSFLKYLVIPTGSSTAMAASSSVGGADDSDESSESEGAMVDVVGR